MNAPERSVSLSIVSDIRNVRLVGAALNGIAASVGLDEVRRGHIELCVVEAVTNSLVHALENEPGHEIVVCVILESKALIIEVTDRGRPMPAELRQPKPLTLDETDPDTLTEGGRGLFLIFSLMDDVSFTERDGANVLRMVTRLS